MIEGGSVCREIERGSVCREIDSVCLERDRDREGVYV